MTNVQFFIFLIGCVLAIGLSTAETIKAGKKFLTSRFVIWITIASQLFVLAFYVWFGFYSLKAPEYVSVLITIILLILFFSINNSIPELFESESRSSAISVLCVALLLSVPIFYYQIKGMKAVYGQEAVAFPIVQSVQTLFVNCENSKLTKDPFVRGQPLLWDKSVDRGKFLGDQAKLDPSALKNGVTVFMFLPRKEKIGAYSATRDAYQYFADICIVYWPEKVVVGSHTVAGAEPPSSIKIHPTTLFGLITNSKATSENLEANVVTWVLSLPKE